MYNDPDHTGDKLNPAGIAADADQSMRDASLNALIPIFAGPTGPGIAYGLARAYRQFGEGTNLNPAALMVPSAAYRMIMIGAMILGLTCPDEHRENCDEHDHSPAGFAEQVAAGLRERDEDSWEQLRAAFLAANAEDEAASIVAAMPDDLTVADILGFTPEGPTDDDDDERGAA